MYLSLPIASVVLPLTRFSENLFAKNLPCNAFANLFLPLFFHYSFIHLAVQKGTKLRSTAHRLILLFESLPFLSAQYYLITILHMYILEYNDHYLFPRQEKIKNRKKDNQQQQETTASSFSSRSAWFY